MFIVKDRIFILLLHLLLISTRFVPIESASHEKKNAPGLSHSKE